MTWVMPIEVATVGLSIFTPFNFAVSLSSRNSQNKGHADIKGFTVDEIGWAKTFRYVARQSLSWCRATPESHRCHSETSASVRHVLRKFTRRNVSKNHLNRHFSDAILQNKVVRSAVFYCTIAVLGEFVFQLSIIGKHGHWCWISLIYPKNYNCLWMPCVTWSCVYVPKLSIVLGSHVLAICLDPISHINLCCNISKH